LGTNVIIAVGMGARALDLFAQNDIKVVMRASAPAPEELEKQYLDNTLQVGGNVCDH
jgi:predicted Fe-Mo cluster-binding NifX family protein